MAIDRCIRCEDNAAFVILISLKAVQGKAKTSKRVLRTVSAARSRQ